MKKTFILTLILISVLYSNALAQQSQQPQHYTVTATAYSMPGRITATQTRARNGVIAVSRDMLPYIPYGSRVRVIPKGNCGFRTALLTVEDTMAAHIHRTVDVHLPIRTMAKKWGRCKATLVLVRKGKGR